MKNVTAAILCGGRASRMGGVDKGLIELNGKPLMQYVLNILELRFDTIIINANRNLDQYSQFKKPVVSDEQNDFLGPLSGMLALLRHMSTDWLFTVPCDTPLLSVDVLTGILENKPDDSYLPVVAHDGKRLQPMFSLLHKSAEQSIAAYLKAGERRSQEWFDQNNAIIVNFAEMPGSFFNINTQKDLIEAEIIHLKKNDGLI